MLIPSPKVIEEYIKKIPRGSEVSIGRIRSDLAKKYKADKTCPITTGIFLRIVSELNYEKLSQGVPNSKITPFGEH
jgi:hypothetical protein